MYIDFYILNPVKEIRFRDYDIAKFLIIYNKKKNLWIRQLNLDILKVIQEPAANQWHVVTLKMRGHFRENHLIAGE